MDDASDRSDERAFPAAGTAEYHDQLRAEAAQQLDRARSLRGRLREVGINPRLTVQTWGSASREERQQEKLIPLENGWITVGGSSRGLEVTLPAADVERLLGLIADRPTGRWRWPRRPRATAVTEARGSAEIDKE